MSDTAIRYQGVLKFYRTDKGFGFIRRAGACATADFNGDDFVHASAIEAAGIKPEALVEGQTRFSYELVEDAKNKKLKAANIRILD